MAIPVFPSRAFRHTSIYIRTDKGINSPEDLKGRRIGVPEYQLTACVWARALLQDEYGVRPSDVVWVRGGEEDPGRPEKIPLQLPQDVRLEQVPEGATLNRMLADGEIDGLIAPRAPFCFDQGHPHVGWLFSDPMATARDYFRRTRIFPIMHTLGVRRELVERHPWLPVTLLKAFEQAKAKAYRALADTTATKPTLPFVEEYLKATRELMGQDYWPYGFEENRHTVKTFLQHHYAQGLSPRPLDVEELFHPTTFELTKI